MGKDAEGITDNELTAIRQVLYSYAKIEAEALEIIKNQDDEESSNNEPR